MGITYTTLKIRNPLTNSEVIDMRAKVDTGATMLVLPESLTTQLNFPKIRKQIVKYANEETAERDIVAGVEVEICGRKGWFEAIVEPKKTYALLGCVILETLDLIVEPRELGIYPNPRSPTLPMAEIEEYQSLAWTQPISHSQAQLLGPSEQVIKPEDRMC